MVKTMDEHEYSKAMDQLTRALERFKPLSEQFAKRKLHRDNTSLPDDVKIILAELTDAVDVVNRLTKQATDEQRERLSLPKVLFAATYNTTFSVN